MQRSHREHAGYWSADGAGVDEFTSRALREQRTSALHQLQARYQQVNPFRFIIYSGWAGGEVQPLKE